MSDERDRLREEREALVGILCDERFRLLEGETVLAHVRSVSTDQEKLIEKLRAENARLVEELEELREERPGEDDVGGRSEDPIAEAKQGE